jgi:hypothetical protein
MKNVDFYTRLAERVDAGATVSGSVGLSEAHKLREEVYSV